MDNSSSLKGKLSYVLGGCGLIGEKTVRDLSDKGCKVIILKQAVEEKEQSRVLSSSRR